MKTILILFLALCPAFVSGGELPYSDPLTSEKQPDRRAMRGEWTFLHGIAKCTQDDELYKKFKDHGPVVWYDLEFTDGKISFAMKADDAVKNFIFTINGADGHIFRFVSREPGTMIKAWPRENDTEQDGILERKGPSLAKNQWIPVEVDFRGESATVKIGDYTKVVNHPAISQTKTTIGLGIAFGTIEFKEIAITP